MVGHGGNLWLTPLLLLLLLLLLWWLKPMMSTLTPQEVNLPKVRLVMFLAHDLYALYHCHR
jgi:hypothetical protein